MAMKLIRLALLALVVLAVFDGTEQSCPRRTKNLHKSIYDETWCKDPVDTFVPLPVPEGYKFVMPSVVKLKQCSGMQCNKNLGEKCLAEEGSINKRMYKVNAYSSDEDSVVDCKEVWVEEHEACDCKCTRTCEEGRVLNKRDCRCECDPVARDECTERRDIKDFPVMYSDQECKCLCDPNSMERCGTGQRRNNITCRCEETKPRREYDYPDSYEDNM